MTKRILMLPGDGIGPEVIGEASRVIEALRRDFGLDVTVEEALLGGAAYDVHGVPMTPETLERAKASDVVLLGAVGGPQWDQVAYEVRPEAALLGLRAGLQVFANLRPAFCFRALAQASTLKPEVVNGLDLIIVRELIGGVYFGEPRGIETLPNGERRGVNTQVYTTSEIRRVTRVAFELARTRHKRVASAEKSNVMESGVLWRQEVQALRDAEYPDIELTHILADNCAMQLVRKPTQFDVIVTDNLFGDLLSDAAAMATGSLGMLPSASLGEPGGAGLYEPIHGTAPDIAGQGVANPCATILSLGMALRLQLDRPDLAEKIESAVSRSLDAGFRTRDLAGGSDARWVGTRGMGDAILERLNS